MDKRIALAALSALGQEARLDVFRLLVRTGQGGLCAGEIAEALGQRQNSLSSNLAILAQAGMVRAQREGRSIRYFADMEGMGRLLGFLMEDCCGGQPDLCRPLIDGLALANCTTC
ncbi:ArsR/SmtB family transcription factor [Fuscibacter oryzae]|uniref:Helix-turn-helix transcriptional regulator n=1 Tax=Fuscibacter oryzae TaxID=2803939 RepID=A0A8J7MP52_9RHOB|nr:metalloregulator ArsR/SmtB family transcription factor [Fuscibacter oryzae]MBL4926504.1 helix-turn-helix transcriptional regulator [Fuscibacter oryzae]